MSRRQDIVAFAEGWFPSKLSGCFDQDVLAGLAIEGDDANEFLEAFAVKFGVDLSELRPEYHYVADEPPLFRRILPVAKDGSVLPFRPINLDDLDRAVDAGHWVYTYPDYELRVRWIARPGFWIVLAVCLWAVWGALHI